MKHFLKYLGFLLILNISYATESPKGNPTNLDSLPTPKYTLHATDSFDIRKELKIKLFEGNRLTFFDFHYIGITHSYFEEYTKWFLNVKTNLLNGSTPESFDCDNFSLLYKSLLSTAVYKNNKDKEILVGVIMVRQKHPMLGIPAGVLHALNIVKTDMGWFVVEPQTGEFINLKDYPNEIRKYIF